MNNIKRYEILTRFYTKNPNPTTELVYRSSFEFIIAVILSSKTTDIQVNKVTSNLFKVVMSPKDILKLGSDKLIEFIRSVGLYNTKAKNIINTCRLLVNKYKNIIPEDRHILESFPGIGRKSANVILNTIFKWPVIAVDTHVFRFCNRSNFVKGSSIRKIEKKLSITVPDLFKNKCHNWMVLHGRYICTAKQPRCNTCYIQDLCEFKLKKLI